jgi:hypothetical protein
VSAEDAPAVDASDASDAAIADPSEQAVLEASTEPDEPDETATDVADAPVTLIDTEVAPIEAAPISARATTSSPPPAPAKDVTPTLLGVGAVGVQLAAALLAAIDETADEAADDAIAGEAAVDAAACSAPVVIATNESADALAASDDVEAACAEEDDAAATVTGFPPGVDPHEALTVVPGAVTPNAASEDASPEETMESIAERLAAHATSIASSDVGAIDATSAHEPPPAPKRAAAELEPAKASDVDTLIARFGVTDARDPKRVAGSLKQLAGLELTEAPPVVWESPRPVVASPLPSAHDAWEAEPMTPTPPPIRRARRKGLAFSAAVLAIGVVTTGALWRFRDDVVPWIEGASADAAPAAATPSPK